MPLLHSKAATVYYAHVPKAGGTSIEDYLIAQFGPLSLYDPYWTARSQPGWPQKFACSDQHLVWADACALMESPPDLVFGMVRDPLGRVISEYRFQSRHNRKMGWLTRRGFSVWLAVLPSPEVR